MSISPPTARAQANSDLTVGPQDTSPPPTSYVDGLKRRLPFYGAAALVAILGLAWIDGGEEPIHPIAHAVDLESVGLETN